MDKINENGIMYFDRTSYARSAKMPGQCTLDGTMIAYPPRIYYAPIVDAPWGRNSNRGDRHD